MNDQWVKLCEASRLSGKHEGHLRKLCKNTWQAQGLAEIRRPPGGGRKCWFVHTSALAESDRGYAIGVSISDSETLRKVMQGIIALNRVALTRVWALVEAELHTARIPASKAGFVAGSTASKRRIERHSR